MADGLNEARSMRIAEVMNDFRIIQHRILGCQAQVPPGEETFVGHVMLRACHKEAQTLLASPFNPAGGPGNDSPEQLKRQFQRVLLDASSRRFRAHRIYLRASAAVRWATRRQQVLKGQKPQPSHSQVLKQNDDTLKQTINTITDKKVYDELRAKDTAAGNWIAEMADLKTLLAYVRSH